MDTLAANGKPFFFMVNFLMTEIELYTEKDLMKSGIFIDFKNFKTKMPCGHYPKNIQWEIYPESIDEYRKGFDEVQRHYIILKHFSGLQ